MHIDEKEEKILAFIDLLGFSQMVNSDENKARVVLNDFYYIAFDEIKSRPNVKGHLFSDSLLAYSISREDLINCLAAIYQKCLLKNNSYTELSKFFLLPRGAMSVGIVNVEERQTAPNLTKDFIISQALVHSTELEKEIKGSRLLIAVKTEQQEQLQLTWNRNIRYGLYQNDAFTFLKNYKYSDVLWFSSFDDGRNQKDNLIDLIDIAIKLVKDNSRNEKVMTLIEMIVDSTTEWKYAASKTLVDFYKRTSLQKGWSALIEELNKPGEQNALKCFKKFIDEMPIQTTL